MELVDGLDYNRYEGWKGGGYNTVLLLRIKRRNDREPRGSFSTRMVSIST